MTRSVLLLDINDANRGRSQVSTSILIKGAPIVATSFTVDRSGICNSKNTVAVRSGLADQSPKRLRPESGSGRGASMAPTWVSGKCEIKGFGEAASGAMQSADR